VNHTKANHRRILVLGGTGHLGRQVVRALGDLGAIPRVMSRDAEGAHVLFGDNVEIVGGDLLDEDSASAALTDCDAMGICVSAFSRKLIRRLREIEVDGVVRAFGAAETAGVSRVVYLSVYQPDHPLAAQVGMRVGPIKQEVEERLLRTRLNWTVLGAPPSMDIFFAFIRGQKMIVPGGGPPAFPTLSSTDIGIIMAEALLRSDLEGQRFRLTGPAPLSFPEAAKRIGDVWGRPIAFRKVPLFIPRLAAAAVGPFVPFVKHVVASLRLLNAFPEEMVRKIPADFQRLNDTFSFSLRTLEEEAKARLDEGS
jgi:uncharacterized protein YbjT (DUF2867 family)